MNRIRELVQLFGFLRSVSLLGLGLPFIFTFWMLPIDCIEQDILYRYRSNGGDSIATWINEQYQIFGKLSVDEDKYFWGIGTICSPQPEDPLFEAKFDSRFNLVEKIHFHVKAYQQLIISESDPQSLRILIEQTSNLNVRNIQQMILGEETIQGQKCVAVVAYLPKNLFYSDYLRLDPADPFFEVSGQFWQKMGQIDNYLQENNNKK